MVDPSANLRYVVSNFGYGWAVQDTGTSARYAFRAGRDKEHASSNLRNTRVVNIFPTRAQAQAQADELNAKDGVKRG